MDRHHRFDHVRAVTALGWRRLGVSSLALVSLALLPACGTPAPAPGGGGGGGGGGEHCVTSLDGAFVFAANDGVHGIEPWISDGTPEGTCLLLDTAPGPDGYSLSADVLDFVAVRVGGVAMFRAAGGVYVSDGTPEGTELRHPDGRLREAVRVGDTAYVNARFPSLGGNGTYRIDGTDEGTSRLGGRFDGLDRGYLTLFGTAIPGATPAQLFVTGDQQLRLVRPGGVDVLAEFTRECDVHSELVNYDGHLYFTGAIDPDGMGIGTRCQLWRLSTAGHLGEHRRLAASGTQQVANLSFAVHDGWLYYTHSVDTASGIVLRATNGAPAPLEPTEPDLNDVLVSVDGVVRVIRLVQRAPGSPMYAVATPTDGPSQQLVRLSGPADAMVATPVDDAPLSSFSRLSDAPAVWLGNRLVYVSSGNGLRSITDGSTSPVTLIPPDGARPFYAILHDVDHDRAYVWTRELEGDDRFYSLWVTDGTPGGTRLLRTYCEMFSPGCH